MRRRLDVEMVRRHLVDSRAAAARAIRERRVVVTGTPLPKPATMVDGATAVRILEDGPRYVSRGGLKLEAAIREFRVGVAGRGAIDVGASTGGFTHCLLEHGASHVVAVDVGYGQLHLRMRDDPRVTVVERTNIRYADPGALGAPFDLVVADVSFISLRTICHVLVELGNGRSDYLLLIKPQFEAGRGAVDRRGVVRDRRTRAGAVLDTITGLAGAGLGAVAVTPSPIKGANGNREVMGLFRHGANRVAADTVREAVR
ncbi:MAG: TlyA family RNA methyltransferase [bacterium]|nr:TlyA family RNA methyltransferase [bacterium]MDE0287566.1 TlyA family RNA methyltransferase [bacterium]MDE0439291.1 TlyA family RNA methyltransferase [bacterium]